MSGNTTELNLKTAVDSDDNADYLTLSLASSLQTVDALFSSTTGHTHNGAHQGGPLGIATGSITSAMIADGTIATVDLANSAVTNAKLGSDTARLNLLTNGGFEIWQRGNGPFTASSAFFADRWTLQIVGTDTFSVSKNSANADAAQGSLWCAAVTFVLGSGVDSRLGQVLSPPLDGHQLYSRPLAVSVRVRTSTASAVRVGIYNGAGWTYGAFHTGDGTYQTLSAAATATSGAANVQLGVFFAASCTAYVDNAMLVVGSVAADYAPLHPADDLARCLRYYEVVGADSIGEVLIQGAVPSASQVTSLSLSHKATKPVTPTATKTGTWVVSNCGQPIVFQCGRGGLSCYTTATAGGQFSVHNGASNCTISVESNP